jgi:hypothetical protein
MEYSSPGYHLCGLVVSVEDYKHGGPGFDSRALLMIFLREFYLNKEVTVRYGKLKMQLWDSMC